jgi:hypothetical protein
MLDDTHELMLLILFIMFLLCLMLIGIMNISFCNDYPKYCTYINSSELNNGDIVCVSYKNIAGYFVSSFSSSIWSHTGIIWVDPITNIRYVSEGAIYSIEKYKHFMRIPFELWLYINRKNIIGYKKYNGPRLNSKNMEKIMQVFEKNCKLDGFNVFWSKFLIKRPYYEYYLSNKYTCIEYSVILLQLFGIYKKEHIYSSYLPYEIVNDLIKTNDGIKYDKICEIKISPLQFETVKNFMSKEKQKTKKN